MSGTNVLHVIDTLSVGGAEKLLVGTVNGLSQFNHHVVYLSGSDALAKDLPADCKIVKLNFRSKLDTFRCVKQLRRYIRENDIDIVHSHLVMATIIARLACPRHVQLFSSIHSLLGKRCFAPRKKLQRMVEKITYSNRHHVIAVSEEVSRDYDRSIGIKGAVSVLPNFVEDKFYKPAFKSMSFNGTFRMVTVGSLKPAKNYPYLIEAFKNLPKGIHLDIYGDGPLKETLQRDIEQHNLNIRLCGVNANMHELLHKYDMFVMTSIFEGHPIALLEAMASGMPALVSDIPVLREATGNKGIYCDLENVDDFITKVKAIAGHTVDLDEYAKANFERAKMIGSKDNYMRKLSGLYSNVSLARERKAGRRTSPVPMLLPGNFQPQPNMG